MFWGGTPGFCNIGFSVHLLKIISADVPLSRTAVQLRSYFFFIARSLSPLHSQVLETVSRLQCSDGDRKGRTLGGCSGSYRTSVLVLANVLQLPSLLWPHHLPSDGLCCAPEHLPFSLHLNWYNRHAKHPHHHLLPFSSNIAHTSSI